MGDSEAAQERLRQDLRVGRERVARLSEMDRRSNEEINRLRRTRRSRLMVIDHSAIVAVLRNKPEAAGLERAPVSNPIRLAPSTCMLEARMEPVGRRGEPALAGADLWLHKIEAGIFPVDTEPADQAVQAWLACDKGRHPTALNFAAPCPASRQNAPAHHRGSSARTLVRWISRRHRHG